MVEHLAVVNRLAQIFHHGNKMKRDQTVFVRIQQNPGYPSSILGGGMIIYGLKKDFSSI